MSIKNVSLKRAVHALAVVAIAAGSLIPVANSANAGEWHRQKAYGRHDGGYAQNWQGRRHFDRGYGYERGYGNRRHHDHAGRAVAIGAFAAILGLALAAESAKVQRDYYDYED